MLRHVARFGLLAGLLAFLLPGSTGADKPTRVEIAKRGKAATAFVDVPGRGTGTAFCIHSSGLFLTNEHVIRGADEVTLVLNPSLESQKVLKAKVIRVDKDSDLALLRVAGVKDLPSIPLGKVDDVSELADVVACGFPLGKALSPDKKEYPAISVNAGTVTALRQKGGELQFIQIDVALTYGNSGGPVLDDNGKLVGVVVSGVAGGKAGINQAIPVNKVEKFLKTPDVSFTPPNLTPANADKPQEFRARVVSFVPNLPDPGVKLVLQAGDEKPREFVMKKVGGEWVVTATPIVKTVTSQVELSARIGNASITGFIDDTEITVGGKVVKLRAVRKIEFTPKPVATLIDGKTLEGDITGLGAVEIRLGEQKLKVDLSKATQITTRATEEVQSVAANVIVTIDGKEVARAGGHIPVREGGSTTSPGSVAINPPTLTDDKVTRQLPDVFSEVAVAGGGRYLVFQIPKLKKLAIFDVSEAKVTNYIPLAEEKATFAAGLDCVIVGLPGAGRLERWSLTTFEREKNVSYAGEIANMRMGHSATYAVVVGGVFLDPVTFRPLTLSPVTAKGEVWTAEYKLLGSGDGTAFTTWNAHLSPSEVTVISIEGTDVKRYFSANLGHAIVGPDGRWVYTAKGVYTRDLKTLNTDDTKYGFCLPATRGDYFLSLATADEKGVGGSFTVYHRGMKGPIGRLEKADHGLKFDNWGRDAWGPWRRVFFIPEAKVIAVLPVSNDRVVLHKFDLDDALTKSGLDFLFVTSQPPGKVKAGETFTYPLVVKSKNGGLTYKLDSAPKGMTVSTAGVVTWAVPTDATGEHEIILTVKDKTGQDVFHTFTVKIAK